MTVVNCTAKDNARVGANNYAFYSVIANVVRNCIADSPDAQSFNAAVVHDHNSWDSGKTVSDADYLSVDFTNNIGARQSDGSLPASDFLKLAPGSDLIDAGVDVGLSFNGTAPDMGAYES